MDLNVLYDIMSASGSSIIFVGAIIYLYKAQEKKEHRQDVEQREREKRLGARLDSTEEYIRTSLQDTLGRNAEALSRNTEALNGVKSMLAALPCCNNGCVQLEKNKSKTEGR